MRKKYVSICYFLIFPALCLSAFSQEDNWRKLKVMVSTRDDVRKLLAASDEGSNFELYSLKDATIDVTYSYGTCKDPENSGWNVPENTVLEYAYTPLFDLRLSSLKLNLNKFKRIRESPDVPELVTYINYREGVRYVVQRDGMVSTIGYFPSITFQRLRCSKTKNATPSPSARPIARGTSSARH